MCVIWSGETEGIKRSKCHCFLMPRTSNRERVKFPTSLQGIPSNFKKASQASILLFDPKVIFEPGVPSSSSWPVLSIPGHTVVPNIYPSPHFSFPLVFLLRTFPLRGSHSMDDLLDRPSAPSTSDYWHSPSRPQSPSPSLALLGAGSRRSSMANATTATSDAKVR